MKLGDLSPSGSQILEAIAEIGSECDSSSHLL